jgi:hypothetical protein
MSPFPTHSLPPHPSHQRQHRQHQEHSLSSFLQQQQQRRRQQPEDGSGSGSPRSVKTSHSPDRHGSATLGTAYDAIHITNTAPPPSVDNHLFPSPLQHPTAAIVHESGTLLKTAAAMDPPAASRPATAPTDTAVRPLAQCTTPSTSPTPRHHRQSMTICSHPPSST